LSGLQWCLRNTQKPNSMSVLAPDAGISDVAIVVTLCLFMAVIRLTLVHVLVPNYNQPKRLEALVRCKSIHLLSSSYPGSVTPQSSVKRKTMNLDQAGMLLAIPKLQNNQSQTPVTDDAEGPLKPKRLFGDSSGQEGFLLYNSGHEATQPEEENDFDLGTGLDVDAPKPDPRHLEGEDDISTAPAVSSGLLTSSSALSFQALLHQAAHMTPVPRRDSLTHHGPSEDPPERIFAAPKYATACFRMLFCSASCIIALIYFKNADFWPPAVGGHGSTKNCWDLSSVGSAVMDSDFDHHNTVLRRYYLVQLSYHFHSGAFHILAALLLWFVSSKNTGRPQIKHFGFIPTGLWTIHNLQSLSQHCFAVGMMTFTYLFSSLRRLGVIAMFAFDLSSFFLHLLQMSINVPSGRRRISPFWINILHRAFVIPVFCYCRFYIFPFVIGYSALEESQDWLRQLENMSVPGTARYIHGIFVVSFCLLMVMTMVYARRLFYHPHVKDTVASPNR